LGCIYDDRGHKMTPSHVRMRGIMYRYYISIALLQGQAEQAGTVSRIPADEIQALVVKCVRGHLNESTDIENAILIPNHVVRVEVQSDQLVIELANARGADPKRKRSRNVIECLGTRHHQPGAAKFSRPKPDRFKTPAPSATL
jgi:site-specific DNA recombinase